MKNKGTDARRREGTEGGKRSLAATRRGARSQGNKRRTTWARVYAMILSLCLVVDAGAQGGSSYPEQRRFDPAEFHEGLRSRGLTKLLALHLKEHPPADAIEAVLLNRDAKLAEYADPSRSLSEQAAAVDAANRLLESLIDQHPDDKRARQWRLELGRSLLYTQAERYTSSVLYRGGGEADRKALRTIMNRAVAVLSGLHAALTIDYENLDTLPARRYDRMEASGDIDRLESDLARADYMLAWARFYRALALDERDPERGAEFRNVLDYLNDRSNLLDTPHTDTHFQAQALLLAGMSYRQVDEYQDGRTMLGRAVDVVADLADEQEQTDLAWVVTVARIELVRSYRDSGSFDAARQGVDLFRNETKRSSPDNVGLLLVGALLEREVYRSAADRAEADGRLLDADAFRARAVRGLTLLAVRDPTYRAETYATLYEILGHDADPASLEPFERCALIAGALGEADALGERLQELTISGIDSTDAEVVRLEERRAAELERAIAIARPMMEPNYPIAVDLQPEVAFNMGVALHGRGRRLEAARSFLQVAREYPEFYRAPGAATFAVQLASEVYLDASLGARTEVRNLYLDALTTLTDKYTSSEAARYWQFFLAHHLSALGRHAVAAEAYEKVDENHERFHEAKYLAAESRSLAVKQFAAEHPDDLDRLSRQATSAIRAASNAEQDLTRAASGETDLKRRAELRHLTARANVIAGELYAVPGVSRWNKALEKLGGFEKRFANETALIGRVLRVRMIALEALGRHDEASDLIPQYVASDPAGAAPTLQGLFDAMREEIEADKNAGLERRARARAESAVVIADGIYNLAIERPDMFDAAATYSLRLQLAETLIETGDLIRAKELFAECLTADRARYPEHVARDSRAIYGMAESYFGLRQYLDALPLFNRIFQSSERGSRLWWEALLYDLRCRTALEHPSGGIIRSIRQHKYLDREMGGEHLRRQFDTLLTVNERR